MTDNEKAAWAAGYKAGAQKNHFRMFLAYAAGVGTTSFLFFLLLALIHR